MIRFSIKKREVLIMKKNSFPYSDGAELFRAILEQPELLSQLPTWLRYDKDFLDVFYIILGDEIAPYIPYQIFKQFKCSDLEKKPATPHLENAPKTILGEQENVIHQLFTHPDALAELSTDDKYDDDLLEVMYMVWGKAIQPYLPSEMYQQLEDEDRMRQYHISYENGIHDWAKTFTKQ